MIIFCWGVREQIRKNVIEPLVKTSNQIIKEVTNNIKAKRRKPAAIIMSCAKEQASMNRRISIGKK